MEWTVTDEGSLVVVRTQGRFDVEDHRRMVEDVIHQPFWSPGRPVLFDHTALSFAGTDFSGMQEAVSTHQARDERIGGGPAAIVMTGDAHFGFGRMFESLASDRVSAQLRVVRTEAEGREWLMRARP